MVVDMGYRIIVPINETGRNSYDYGLEDAENLIVFDIPYDEFHILYPTVTEDINEKYGLLIDEYEDETIEADIVNEIMNILKSIDGIENIKKAFSKARELNTELYLEF